ncbi:MAG TPA: ABC transporter substrate-binding protein [Candidatus Binatia bacterium]|jgi:ABC-type nitrate/sulfonate/bicarbonate transport system substrate-binding protein
MAERLTTLRYGQVQLSAMNWPFFIAEALDLFAEYDLSVERNIFTRPPDPVAALIDGSLDVINVIPDVALLETVKGAPLAVIANTNDRPQYRLMAQADIQDVRQLEGKKIGVNDGRSAEALILRKLLRAYHLKDEQYELVPAGPPLERCEKLRQGALNATMVTEPFHFLLEKDGFGFLGSSIEVAPAYPFTVCVVRRTSEVDERFVNFLRALKKAWDWLADSAHRSKAVDILSRATETAPALAEQTYDLYLTTPEPPSLEPTQHGVAAVLELLAESKRLPLPLPPARRYIDSRHFEAL